MKTCAPGKIILSGEHAVVHGFPALALAVNRYVTCDIIPHDSAEIFFDLSDLSFQQSLSLQSLCDLKNRIQCQYENFLQGKIDIREVLTQPFELVHYTVAFFLDVFEITLSEGFTLYLRSTVPMGSGMGSSAATILSVTRAMMHHLNITLTTEELWLLVWTVENRQHGFSSGMDLRVILQGGCLLWQENATHARTLPTWPFYLIHTGVPQTSTGECVNHAKHYFETSSIGEEFAAVTRAFDVALQKNNVDDVMSAVRENHKLLMAIGVVPNRVQDFIREIELFGAAKISGAGAIVGDSAGMVLVVTEDKDSLEKICQQYSYSLLNVTGEPRGVYVV